MVLGADLVLVAAGGAAAAWGSRGSGRRVSAGVLPRGRSRRRPGGPETRKAIGRSRWAAGTPSSPTSSGFPLAGPLVVVAGDDDRGSVMPAAAAPIRIQPVVPRPPPEVTTAAGTRLAPKTALFTAPDACEIPSLVASALPAPSWSTTDVLTRGHGGGRRTCRPPRGRSRARDTPVLEDGVRGVRDALRHLAPDGVRPEVLGGRPASSRGRSRWRGGARAPSSSW